MDKITMIKKDAILEMKVGTGFFQKLQSLLFFMFSQLTPEQVEQFKKESSAGTGLSEEWMQHVTTLSILIKSLEESAINTGNTYEKEFEEGIKELEKNFNDDSTSSTEE